MSAFSHRNIWDVFLFGSSLCQELPNKRYEFQAFILFLCAIGGYSIYPLNLGCQTTSSLFSSRASAYVKTLIHQYLNFSMSPKLMTLGKVLRMSEKS